MTSPAAELIRRLVAPAVLAAALAPAPAAAGPILEFSGPLASAGTGSFRFDGADFFEDEYPLFDPTRFVGGSFAATIRLPDVAPSATGNYAFAPPGDVTYTLFDAAGGIILTGRGTVSEAVVRNADRTRPPPRPGPRPGPGLATDEVSFTGAADLAGVPGLTLPPELYGPNVVAPDSLSFEFSSTFGRGTGPLPGTGQGIPTDVATYLTFDDRTFDLFFYVYNGDDWIYGDPDAFDPFVASVGSLSYTVTVPEPASLTLAAAGGLGVLAARLRRRATR